jgi:hypothetical protein
VLFENERDEARPQKAARFRAYAAEAEQRVAWQTEAAAVQVYRSVVRAWTRLADELERVPLPAFDETGEPPPHLRAVAGPATQIDRLRRRAAHARELAEQVPDAETRARLTDYAARLNTEVAELARALQRDG